MNATSVNLNSIADTEPGYGQLLGVLLRRRWWLVSVLLGAIGIAALYTLRQQPTFLSSMQLLVEPIYQGKQYMGRPEKISEEFTDTTVQIDSATQINLLESSSLLRRAMKLVATDYPELDPSDPRSVMTFKEAISVSQVASAADRKNNSPTNIFQIVYISNDPTKTQKVLAALKQVYLEYNLEQQQLRLKKGLSFINERLPQIEAEVQQSESALKQFRQSQELLDPELQGKAQVEALYQIQQAQQVNRAQIRELQGQYESLQRQIAISPEQAMTASRLSQSPRYQALLAEIQKTELALEQQRLRFNDGTPQIQQFFEQRQRQFALLQEESNRILGGNTVSGNRLLSEGQLSTLDQTLVKQLVDAQVNLNAAQAKAQSLAAYEQQLRKELRRFPALLAEYGRLQPEIELNRDTLKDLLKARQDLALEIARGGFDWQVVEEPQYGFRTGPDLRRNLLLGAVAGLFLGGLVAFAREAADDAIHDSDDLKRHASLPVLGSVPELALASEDEDSPLIKLPFRKSASQSSEIAQILHWQPFRESLDLLYQNIQFHTASAPLKSLVITSALPSASQSALVLGLAISAARLHQRVLLVDADLRHPRLHQLLNLPNDSGLSTLLASNDPIPQDFGEIHASNLRGNISVVTAGPTPADPAKLLSSQRMQDIISTFENSYDLVLLDAPSVLGIVDAMIAASYCSGVLMVSQLGHVSRSDFNRAAAMLSKLNVIGVVASGTERSASSEQVHYQLKTS